MNIFKTYTLSIVLGGLLLTGITETMGQISSATADAVKPLDYLTHPAIDQLFVFYQKHESFYPGQLTAKGPGSGNFDFIWTKYDPASDGFNIPLQLDTSALFSTVDNLDEGGYRVQISNGLDIDTTFIGWVMLDNFKVWTVKDELGQVPDGESGCPGDLNWIRVAGGVELDREFYYFDLQTHDTLRISNNFDMEWTSDNAELIIPGRTNKNKLAGNYSEDPPYEDTWYILTATDSLGMTEVDSVFYDTKFTKAEFTVEYWDKVVAQETPTLAWDADLSSTFEIDKGSLDAPLTVRFLNESVNGDYFTWVFLDTLGDNSDLPPDEFDTEDKDFVPEFTYYTADKYYYPYLISYNNAGGGCRDTFFLEDGINVVKAQLLVPNVFSPNGDGKNDYFIFQHQSILEFKITISDRFGRVIYRQKINSIYEWDGWNGKVLNSNTEAPEGQYYYVIEGTGYDNKEFRDPNYLEQRKLDRLTGDGGLFGGLGGSTPTDPNAGEETPTTNLYTGWIYLFR